MKGGTAAVGLLVTLGLAFLAGGEARAADPKPDPKPDRKPKAPPPGGGSLTPSPSVDDVIDAYKPVQTVAPSETAFDPWRRALDTAELRRQLRAQWRRLNDLMEDSTVPGRGPKGTYPLGVANPVRVPQLAYPWPPAAGPGCPITPEIAMALELSGVTPRELTACTSSGRGSGARTAQAVLKAIQAAVGVASGIASSAGGGEAGHWLDVAGDLLGAGGDIAGAVAESYPPDYT